MAGFYGAPEGRAIGGLGIAWQATAAGPERLPRLDRRLAGLPTGVEALVGFSFHPDGPSGPDWDGFPGATAVVPQITVSRTAGRSRLTLALPPGARSGTLLAAVGTLRTPPAPEAPRGQHHQIESRPPAAEWRDRVAETIDAIRAGGPQKVVLARSVAVTMERPIDAFDLLALLRDRHPSCRVYGWQAGEAAFVGASPELLVARLGRWFHTRPLAGSMRRGTDPEEDRRLGDQLLSSLKDRAEHAFVVDEIGERLESLAETMDRPPMPSVARFAGVQHLATPITGTTSARLLDLADALHPTAAVGGIPRSEALAFIEKMEADRGWYAGGIGWSGPDGDGEIAGALRGALIRAETALLHAGNGIIAESDADQELEETRLKLRPVLDLLAAV